jgi:phosphoesterase RecJ-like protein
VAYNCKVPRDVVEALQSGQTFLLAAHIGLDGDHLGSMLALGRALRKAGKRVCCYLPETVPDNYHFMPDLDLLDAAIADLKFDTLVTLECPDVQRLPNGISIPEFQKAGVKVINLDHHPDNERYGDILWIEPDAGALGEMIFDILQAMGCPLDKEIATAIYTAILTDTGSFQYSRVTPHTHSKLAELLRFGLATDDISRVLFRDTRASVVKLLGKVLSRVQITPDGLLAYAELPLAELEEAGVSDGETRFFIDDIDRIKGPEAVAIFREMAGQKVKISLRSRKIAINHVAAQFGGGGHPMAAGCVVSGSLESVRERVVDALTASLASSLCPPKS